MCGRFDDNSSEVVAVAVLVTAAAVVVAVTATTVVLVFVSFVCVYDDDDDRYCTFVTATIAPALFLWSWWLWCDMTPLLPTYSVVDFYYQYGS